MAEKNCIKKSDSSAEVEAPKNVVRHEVMDGKNAMKLCTILGFS